MPLLNPEIMFGVSMAALISMFVAVMNIVVIIFTTISSLKNIRENAMDLYSEILCGKKDSWVDRHAASRTDAGTSIELMRRLSRGDGRTCKVVGVRVCKVFRVCVFMAITAFSLSLILAAYVLGVGFSLANSA